MALRKKPQGSAGLVVVVVVVFQDKDLILNQKSWNSTYPQDVAQN